MELKFLKDTIRKISLPHIILIYFVSCLVFLSLLGRYEVIQVSTWISLFNLCINFGVELNWEFYVVLIIWFVSLCILIYSLNYISETIDFNLFYIYMSFFVLSITILTVGSNMFVMLIGWEGVGIVSYLLINYWNLRIEANKSSLKALLLNKIGDFCFVFGSIFLFNLFLSTDNVVVNSLSIYVKHELIYLIGFEFNLLTLIGYLLVLTAISKSAQLHFCMWLPDAMEGPTPVSALIHSSTMVAAGYILLLKYYLLLQIPSILFSICLIGLLTNLLSTVTLFSTTDIKNTLANSTLAQIAYMFFLFGYGYPILSLTQFSTHAFYKSLLFLSFGGLIHQMRNNQDGRLTMLLYIQNPVTYTCILVGLLSFVSIPAFIAHFSKISLLNLTITQNYGIYYGIYIITEYSQVINLIAGIGLLFILFDSQLNIKTNKLNIVSKHSWEVSNLYSLVSIVILGSSTLLLGPLILSQSLDLEFVNLPFVAFQYNDLFFNVFNLSGGLFIILFVSSFSVIYFFISVVKYNYNQVSAINNWFIDKSLNYMLQNIFNVSGKFVFLMQNKFFFPLTYLKLIYKF